MTPEHWNPNQIAANCDACGVGFVIDRNTPPPICPNCLRKRLEPVDEATAAELLTYAPECVLPFQVSPDSARSQMESFIKSLPFRPRDLTVDHLLSRVEQVYMPMWWVDVAVKAQWQAEVGFDYDAISHRMAYKGGWTQETVHETRAKWEPRLGILERTYQNIVAPALEDDRMFQQRMGGFRLESPQPYDSAQVADAIIRLPQREPADAWSTAELQLKQTAAQECQEACGAQHIREFKWGADFGDKHWTHLLLPVYVSFYFGADGRRHWVMINGQSGKLIGERVANLWSAIRFSSAIFVAAVVLFILGVALAFIGNDGLIAACGGFAIVAGVLTLLASPAPMLRAWWFNRSQTESQRAALS